MDFFAKQESARRHTGRLLVLFFIAVALIITAVHLVVSLALKLASGAAHARFTDPTLLAIDVAATLVVILCGVGVTRSSLSGGGEAVAKSCGGRRVQPSSRDPQERRLLNVVEEMAIASGVPVPPVFVLPEDGINAFAAGRTTSDAAVAVTRGALEQLKRDELQGVVGHEFSHILNGDMKLNMRLAGWLGGIMGLAVIGEVLLRVLGDSSSSSSRRSSSSSSSKKDGGSIVAALFVIGLGLFIIGYIGVFFARLIQAAVSRQREFLADASSVQFTRNPQGLANALKKIAGFAEGSALRTPHASMLRHMFFSNAAKPSWLDFAMATHPPIEQRIQWLDPAFNPEMAKLAALPRPSSAKARLDEEEDELVGVSALASPRRKVPDLPALVGTPRLVHLRRAANFVTSLPDAVRSAVGDPHGACAVVYALLLCEEPALRAQQLERLRELAGEPAFEDLTRLEPIAALREAANKMPVLELALTGLRRMNRAQFEQFGQALRYLVESDGFLDRFEFTLQKALRRHLDVYFGVITVPKKQVQHIASVRGECVVLLSCLARQGHRDDAVLATTAYRAGVRRLALDRTPTEPLAQDACKLDALDAALDRLNAAPFPLKKRILSACVAAVSADGEVHVEEAELLRAVSDTLDCPVPMPPALP